MKTMWRALIVGLVLNLTSVAAAEIVVTGDAVVPVVVNGTAGRIRIDPAVPALPMLVAPYAMRGELRPGPFAFAYLVGPERVLGRSAVTRITIGEGGEERRRRVGWTERPYYPEADGVIGPGGLPDPVVRFVLRPSLPSERTVTLPMVDEGGLFGGWGGMYALVDVGGTPIRIRFNPFHPRTLATAGAAIRLAAAHEGLVGGEAESVQIAFGIARPVRTLRLQRPLVIGPISISTLGVRTSDFGNASAIREEGGDPDEIVVTAERRRNTERDRIALGADSLARCSSIVFDRDAGQIRLTCA